jgi:NHL repeat-containing protein
MPVILVVAAAFLLATLGAPDASAELRLPAGFVAHVYVTGQGYESTAGRLAAGVPSASTLAFDEAGALYLARTGRRYIGGDADDLLSVYRIPAGGARLSPDTEAPYRYGPPLRNPQVGLVRGRELLLTTFDRDRRIGVLYRVTDGRAELLAGGTPMRPEPPLLRQPEGVAADAAGNLYVADREQGAIVKLDAGGSVLDARYVEVRRPRVVAVDAEGGLWVGADGNAEAPWQPGPGEIRRVTGRGEAAVVLRGPIAAGIAPGPRARLFVADRHAARIFFVDTAGRAEDFAAFTEGDAPRTLAFAPDTPATRRAGIAGDLFVVTISRSAWPVNEVVRISGPFDELVRRASAPTP